MLIGGQTGAGVRRGAELTHPWAAERAGGETRGRPADGPGPVWTHTRKHTR